MKTIDMTPTWEQLLQALLAVYESGTAEGRAMALKEMQRMARAADKFNASVKEEESSMRPTNRFARGSAVYECRTCLRWTRSTGRGDNELVTLCADCFDLHGEENALSDTGKFHARPEAILEMIAFVAKKGGHVSYWDEIKAKAIEARDWKARVYDKVIQIEGREWRVVGVGTVQDGKVYCHLVSTTEGRMQKNGWMPKQIGDWVEIDRLK
jgi:hypothetical protein